MLDSLRTNANAWYIKIPLAVLVLSFIGWGVGDFVTGASDSTAIKVDGNKISVYGLSQAYRQNIQNVQRSLGTQTIDDEVLQSLKIGQRTIQNLVQNALLDNAASDMEISVSDKHLVEMIHKNQQFLDDSGNFDADKYKRTLQTIGMNPETYEEQLRQNLLRATVSDLFSTQLFLDKKAIERISAFNNETIDINALRLTSSDILTPAAPTKAQIEEHYNATKVAYMSPEFRSIDVLVVDSTKLAEGITVSEDDLKASYEKAGDTYMAEEERRARHVLVSTEEEADVIITRLAEGSDFATIASELSLDPGSKSKGGDLGYFKSADMVEAFADSAFSLNVGETSDVIQTPFGFHVIKLEDIKPERKLSFEEVREELEENTKFEIAENAYFDAVEAIEDGIAAGDELSTVAQANGLTVLGFDSIKADGTNAANTAVALPELGSEDILAEAFAMGEGDISEALEFSDGKTAYVALRHVTAPRQLSINEVRERIVTVLKQRNEVEALREKARQIILAQNAGATLKAAARSEGVRKNLEHTKGIKRNRENAPEWLDAATTKVLFEVENGKNLGDAVAFNNDLILVEVLNHGKNTLTQVETDATKQQFSASIAQELRQQFMMKLQEEAKIKIDGRMVRQVIPNETIPEAWLN